MIAQIGAFLLIYNDLKCFLLLGRCPKLFGINLLSSQGASLLLPRLFATVSQLFTHTSEIRLYLPLTEHGNPKYETVFRKDEL